MLFVESTSLIRPIYKALRWKPLTESDCREVSHDSKIIQKLYSLLLSHSHNTSVQHICSTRIPQTCTNKSFETLFVCFDGLSVKRQHSIFQTSFWTNLKFKRIPGEKLSHLTYVEMSIQDSKIYPKSIVKFLPEDPKVSEGAINSFQNGTKVRKHVWCI